MDVGMVIMTLDISGSCDLPVMMHATHSVNHSQVPIVVLFLDHALCSQYLSLTSPFPLLMQCPVFPFLPQIKGGISFHCYTKPAPDLLDL